MLLSQEVGILQYINDDITIQQFCRKLWALSYVPEKDVIQVYTSAILPTLPEVDVEDDSNDHDETADYSEKMDIYLNYFESTWLGAVNKRTQIRGKPKFAMKYWVKYNAVLEGREDFTNNHSEAWNSATNVSIPLEPNLWAV